ncbi:polysaccharide biosynthesis/export family protein [Sphingobium sp.]|jgi:polysaccharide export outer membrane protein|uniref:polysaccharide biosynthesis/export family protein n=1 Tax=Sphingobium sp. TaxID=1912891 RepID=UPI000DB55A12|nr:polysaccharide biosynthesis/export family protein [Sphingobium sp.]PZU70932.1 MAG: polysaccharide export protein [Sphingobium sp.]
MEKRLLISIALALFATGPGGCAGPEAKLTPLATAAPTPYQLGPGDQVRLNVYGLDMMSETYLISDTGMLSLPMVGNITASGKTVDGLQADVAAALRAQQLVLDPKVSAQIIAYRPFFITGEVQKPGQYPFVPGMSVMTAVSVAGGFTFRANTKTVKITRANMAGSATQTSPVQPGDLIEIRESWF